MTTRKKKILWVLAIVAVLLVAVRLALPYVVLHYLNKTLTTMDSYYGKAEDINIALIRGAYAIDSIYLNKVTAPLKSRHLSLVRLKSIYTFLFSKIE